METDFATRYSHHQRCKPDWIARLIRPMQQASDRSAQRGLLPPREHKQVLTLHTNRRLAQVGLLPVGHILPGLHLSGDRMKTRELTWHQELTQTESSSRRQFRGIVDQAQICCESHPRDQEALLFPTANQCWRHACHNPPAISSAGLTRRHPAL